MTALDAKYGLKAHALRELFVYDQETGLFAWNVDAAWRSKKGSAAGWKTAKGYIAITIRNRGYMAHRLAWAYVHGEWPSDQIDHINGLKCDNRICNLRIASNSENQQNICRAYKSNSTGILGVSFRKNEGKWMAQIQANSRKRYLGLFNDCESARGAYLCAKRELHTFYVKNQEPTEQPHE